MPILSDFLKQREPAAARRLYTLFQRATKRGELPALKLLTKFQITSSKGQPRAVADYAFTEADAARVQDWLSQQAQKPKKQGVTVEQVQAMSDEELKELIAKQQKPKRRRRKPKTEQQQEG